ncbi:MAG: hypothetical protein KJO21_01420 [Verrucomicrobiae bacterium]|nr:hypothetical protein [Verrucomicrobiae bacterium]NNJ42194.1 hypothetical protein [Akkermansiaceae bacterium]
MQLYRLTLATIFQRKVWIIAFLCVLLLPIILPYLVPYKTNPAMLAPARAQAAWICLWVLAIAWVFFQAARFGDDTARSGMGAYFLSAGVSRVHQMMQIWLACLTFLLPLVVITVAVCLIGAMPSDSAQAKMWVATNLQYAALFLLVIMPLVMVAASIGSRFGGTIGYLIPLSLSVYGMYGVGYLAMMTEVQNNAILDWIYVVSPHYHLADLTPRLVFKHGSMLGSEFSQLVAYFIGIKLVLSMLSTLCYQAKPAA